MGRIILTDNDIKERRRILNGNISEIFRILLLNGEYWYEKFVRYTNFEKTIPFEVYEKLAADFGKMLGVEYNNAKLVLDNTMLGNARKAVIIKSFLQPNEIFVEAHKFLKQYRIDAHEMESDFSNYEVITNSHNKKYIISDNCFDLEFLYNEIKSALIKETEKLDQEEQTDIDILMKQFSNVLLQDYLLGNSDRSAKNWGIICGKKIRITPSFDNTHIFSPRYVHIHGLNITPNALISFLLQERYDEINDAVENLKKISKETLLALLLSYEDEFLDVQFITDFVLQRIEELKEKERKIIDN